MSVASSNSYSGAGRTPLHNNPACGGRGTGATAVIQQLRRGRSAAASPWLAALLKRKPPKLADKIFRDLQENEQMV